MEKIPMGRALKDDLRGMHEVLAIRFFFMYGSIMVYQGLWAGQGHIRPSAHLYWDRHDLRLIKELFPITIVRTRTAARVASRVRLQSPLLSSHPRLCLPPALCSSRLIVDAEHPVGQFGHLL